MLLQQLRAALAQTSAAPNRDNDLTELLIYSAVFIVAIVIIFAIFMAVRAYFARTAQAAQSTPFTLAELRKLHQSGQLTDEQFEKAKQSMIGHTIASTQPPRPTADQSPNSEDDTPSDPKQP